MTGIASTKGRWLVTSLIYSNVTVCDFMCVKSLIVCVVDDGVPGKGQHFTLAHLSLQ